MQERLIFHQAIIFCHRITWNKWFFQTCKKHPLTLMRLQGQALLGVRGAWEKMLSSLSQKGSRRSFTYFNQPEKRRKQLQKFHVWERRCWTILNFSDRPQAGTFRGRSTGQSHICTGTFKQNQQDVFAWRSHLLRSGQAGTLCEQQPRQQPPDLKSYCFITLPRRFCWKLGRKTFVAGRL